MGNNKEEILVAIQCITFNHEPYIRECLEGFVMQKTNFRFVAIVHDDASTDKTAEIIREYESKYPEIIKPIYETENQYSKKDGSLRRIMNSAIEATGAKYVAMCEGDDYWTDPCKLQKQVECLESHSEYTLCFHAVRIYEQSESCFKPDDITINVPTITDIYKLAECDYIHTNTVLYRRTSEILKFKGEIGPLPVGDYPLWMACAKYGLICKLHEEMSVYRRNNTSIWATKSQIYKNDVKIQVVKRFYEVFKTDSKLKSIFAQQYVSLVINQSRLLSCDGKKKDSIKILTTAFHKCESVEDILRIIKRIGRILISR